jgi:hypothetical protein
MHQTVPNVLRTLVHTNPPRNMTQARDIIDDALASAMHAMQTTIATTLGSTPGALAFAQDMFLNVPLIADWQAIVRTHHVNENLRRANRNQCQYDYAPGQQVLKKVHDPTKLGVRTEGSYTIDCVHGNGNLTIIDYWLTPRGLKPWKKKIDAILHMDRSHNATELRMFIGCVNYYHDMWPSCAHILKPLTDQSGLKKRAPIKWTDEMQQAFDKMRLLMAADALAAYTDHNKRFNVYTDASDFQLGACIIQDGRPVAYFSQKLTKSQQNYTTMEKKMLSIIATLEEFQSMLLSANIHVFTDHKT